MNLLILVNLILEVLKFYYYLSVVPMKDKDKNKDNFMINNVTIK